MSSSLKSHITMTTSLSEESLVKKLTGVLNTQDSVQTMSLWILHHKANHEQIVEIWLKVLKKGKVFGHFVPLCNLNYFTE